MQRCEHGVSSISVHIKIVCYTFKCLHVSVQNVRHQWSNRVTEGNWKTENPNKILNTSNKTSCLRLKWQQRGGLFLHYDTLTQAAGLFSVKKQTSKLQGLKACFLKDISVSGNCCHPKTPRLNFQRSLEASAYFQWQQFSCEVTRWEVTPTNTDVLLGVLSSLAPLVAEAIMNWAVTWGI